MRGSIDANVILRFLLGDVEAHFRAAAALLKKSGQLAVADLAFVEVAFVMEREYEMSRADIVQALRGFMLLPVINCNRILFDVVLPHYSSHPALSMEDSCLAAYAKLNRATPLYTFDKKLANQSEYAKLL